MSLFFIGLAIVLICRIPAIDRAIHSPSFLCRDCAQFHRGVTECPLKTLEKEMRA